MSCRIGFPALCRADFSHKQHFDLAVWLKYSKSINPNGHGMALNLLNVDHRDFILSYISSFPPYVPALI